MPIVFWHPICAHFPIVFFMLYPFVLIVSYYRDNSRRRRTFFLRRFLLILGVLSLGIVIYLGDLALNQVMPNLKDFSQAQEHEEVAYILLYLTVPLILCEAIIDQVKHKKKIVLMKVILAIFAFTSLYYVALTGHSGAKIVYDHSSLIPQKIKGER